MKANFNNLSTQPYTKILFTYKTSPNKSRYRLKIQFVFILSAIKGTVFILITKIPVKLLSKYLFSPFLHRMFDLLRKLCYILLVMLAKIKFTNLKPVKDQ